MGHRHQVKACLYEQGHLVAQCRETLRDHRNLSTRTSMFKLLLQTFWAKKSLVKSLLFSTLDKVIYNIVTFLQGSTNPLFTTQNRVEISWKKIAHFFQHARSRSRFLCARHTDRICSKLVARRRATRCGTKSLYIYIVPMPLPVEIGTYLWFFRLHFAGICPLLVIWKK
jgi:hypothetical protein